VAQVRRKSWSVHAGSAQRRSSAALGLDQAVKRPNTKSSEELALARSRMLRTVGDSGISWLCLFLVLDAGRLIRPLAKYRSPTVVGPRSQVCAVQ